VKRFELACAVQLNRGTGVPGNHVTRERGWTRTTFRELPNTDIDHEWWLTEEGS
jgi:hypothetical protein